MSAGAESGGYAIPPEESDATALYDIDGVGDEIAQEDLSVGDNIYVTRTFVHEMEDRTEEFPFEPVSGEVRALPSVDPDTGKHIGAIILRPPGEEKVELPDGGSFTRAWPDRVLRANGSGIEEEQVITRPPAEAGRLPRMDMLSGKMALRIYQQAESASS